MGAPSAIGKVGTTIGASEKILNFLSKPFIIGGISSGTSTLVGESLETMTGTNKRGIEQIGLDVLEDLILGGILGGIGSKIKIKGLNAGRNNYQAIFAGGITRFVNGQVRHLKTLLKGYIAQLVESIRDGVAGEIYDYIKTELFGCEEHKMEFSIFRLEIRGILFGIAVLCYIVYCIKRKFICTFF